MNAGWGAEEFVNRGFHENGDQTITLDFRKHRYNLVHKFLSLSGDFDALLLQRGDNFPIPLLRATSVPKIFWATELVSRNRDQDRNFRSGGFDFAFLRTPQCIDAVVNNKWMPRDRLGVMLSGFDPAVQKKQPGVVKDIDVLFVGSILPRRRRWLDYLKNKGVNLTEAKAFGPRMTDLVNRARIVLNIHAEDYTDTETRVFEVLGCGAFLISETLSAENPFTPGLHYVEVATVDEMYSAIESYLKNDRTPIAEAGYREALEKHTYRHRALQFREQFQTLIDRIPARVGLPVIDKVQVRRYRVIEVLKSVGSVFPATFFRLKALLKKILRK